MSTPNNLYYLIIQLMQYGLQGLGINLGNEITTNGEWKFKNQKSNAKRPWH